MKKRDFNLVGNEGTDNQELAKGIAFVKSRRAELNVVQMVESMRDQAIPNGVIINDAYCDRSMTRDYDREALNAFFATLKEEDFEVVVVRSLNEITDDIYDLEEFVKTITDMGISFNSDGTTTFFAQLEKSSASQKEYLEKLQEKKAAEKKEANKKEQSKQTEVRKTTVQANSKEELLDKIKNIDWDSIKPEENKIGGRFDFSI